jgi:hypothetical protein
MNFMATMGMAETRSRLTSWTQLIGAQSILPALMILARTNPREAMNWLTNDTSNEQAAVNALTGLIEIARSGDFALDAWGKPSGTALIWFQSQLSAGIESANVKSAFRSKLLEIVNGEDLGTVRGSSRKSRTLDRIRSLRNSAIRPGDQEDEAAPTNLSELIAEYGLSDYDARAQLQEVLRDVAHS